ncbi:disease resistance protein (TIR-NBS-LRR class) [Senna tora]|uniref:Disease resistance protein (TIR-NBS-LRR class) n=1 Tax=Senna tora TaxID=362788 RepID=A0A834XGT5_9FABA|nr:disease resistance protein (TIR-NBS-LRR class) [Senna tora]
MASSNTKWKYDVFLSFCDDDEESIGPFIDDLKSALTHNKINIYKRKSEGSTASEDGDCFLGGGKCSDWMMFKGEGSSVLFKMPQVTGCSLKGMTLYITYSSSLANMTLVHIRSVLIVNHTRSTIQIHKKEVLISPSVEEWKDMISDLEPGDKVEVLVVFGHGFIAKETTVYLIFSELVDEKTECSSSHSDDEAINSSEEIRRQRRKKSLLKWFKRR